MSKCKWCGVSYEEHPDRSTGMMETFCEMAQLRKLRDQIVAFAVEPYKNTEDPDVKLLDWNTLGPIIDRACELKQTSI